MASDPMGLATYQQCVSGYAACGSVVGGGIGYVFGGVVGAAGGTLVVPGAGTVAGGMSAAQWGTLSGIAGGGVIGKGLGSVICSEGEEESAESAEARAKRCEANLDRDLETCSAVAKREGKQYFKVCEAQAMLRYSNCLAGRDNEVKAPLPPWKL